MLSLKELKVLLINKVLTPTFSIIMNIQKTVILSNRLVLNKSAMFLKHPDTWLFKLPKINVSYRIFQYFLNYLLPFLPSLNL